MAVSGPKQIAERAAVVCPIIALMATVTAIYSEADFDAQNSHGDPSRRRSVPCPVDEFAVNDSGRPETARCACAPGGDIRCDGGVGAVPTLVVERLRHAPSTSFAGFYAARQDIGGVPAFAFADLSVDRIVLNFNPIGHRQARTVYLLKFLTATSYGHIIGSHRSTAYVDAVCCLQTK